MILNIQKQDNPDFPFLARILANGKEKDVGVKDVAHLKKRLFELNHYLLLSDDEFDRLIDNFKDSGIKK